MEDISPRPSYGLFIVSILEINGRPSYIGIAVYVASSWICINSQYQRNTTRD